MSKNRNGSARRKRSRATPTNSEPSVKEAEVVPDEASPKQQPETKPLARKTPKVRSAIAGMNHKPLEPIPEEPEEKKIEPPMRRTQYLTMREMLQDEVSPPNSPVVEPTLADCNKDPELVVNVASEISSRVPRSRVRKNRKRERNSTASLDEKGEPNIPKENELDELDELRAQSPKNDIIHNFHKRTTLLIAKELDLKDLNSFSRTTHYLYHLLSPLVRKFATEEQHGLPPFLWAIRMGYEGLVRILLGLGVDPNEQLLSLPFTELGILPLCEAIAHGHSEVVQLLLNNSADPNLRDFRGRTAFHYVADPGNAFSFQAKEDIDLMTLMQFAVSTETTEIIINLLLEAGGNIDIQDWEGYTPMHLATIGSAISTPASFWMTRVGLLLEYFANPDIPSNSKDTPLHTLLSVSTLAESALELLMTMIAETSPKLDSKNDLGRTALHIATQNGFDVAVRILLENGADPNIGDKDGIMAIHLVYPAADEPVNVYSMLLRAGADINSLKHLQIPILQAAIGDKDPDVVEFLLENGTNAGHRNKEGYDMLHLVLALAENGPPDSAFEALTNIFVKQLGSCENYGVSRTGDTLLHRAVKLGFKSTVEFLLDNGASTEIRNDNGGTVLNEAADLDSWRGNTEHAVPIVKLLLDHGAVIDAKDSEGQSPLAKAGKSDYMKGRELVNFLTDRGAETLKFDDMKWRDCFIYMDEMFG